MMENVSVKETVQAISTDENKLASKLKNLRLLWLNENEKSNSHRSFIPEKEMPEKNFNELIVAFGSISMVRQFDKSKFIIDSDNTGIIHQLYLYVTGNKTFNGCLHKGIMLMGPFGTGKSILMEAFHSFWNDYAQSENGIRRHTKLMKYYTAMEIFNIIKKMESLPAYMINTSMIIDELGREPKSALNFGSETTPVIDLLHERYRKGLITHGTSNFVLRTLSDETMYGPMIGDRLKSMFNFIELPGKSRRN